MCKSITRLFLCAGLFAGHVFTAQNSFAQVWPAVTWEWSDAFIDNKYVIAKGQLYGDGPRSYGGPKETCAVEPCGWPSYGNYESNTCSTYLDGQLYPYCNNGEAYFPDRMAEGVHNAVINFLGCIGTFCWSSPDSPKVPYTFTEDFYVDNSPPVVTITTPKDNSVILPADALFKGNVTDSLGVGIETSYIEAGVSGGCTFKEGIPGRISDNAANYLWCGSKRYAAYPDCNINLGTVKGFTPEYNFFQQLNIPLNTNCAFTVVLHSTDRLGNIATNWGITNFVIDNAPPTVTITTPENMVGLDRENPVIAGEVRDYIGVVKMWLTIQDDQTHMYWSGSGWQDGAAKITVNVPRLLPETGITEKVGTWEYAGLTKNGLNSGRFTIKAYAQDKGGLVGKTQGGTLYTRRDYLGSKDFTAYTISVKEVKNIARPVAANSFVMKSGEDVIGITAEIFPVRVASSLNSYVKWNVFGANSISGNPVPPLGGNPSRFYVKNPPILIVPAGRGAPMGYTIFPRVDYEGSVYYGPDHQSIYQNPIDKCRQEYVDLGKTGKFDYTLFKTGASDYNTGNCDAYIMLPATISELETVLWDPAIDFRLWIGSAYRNPIYNANIPGPNGTKIKGATESPHLYGRGLDVNPDGKPDCAHSTKALKTECCKQIEMSGL